jgi:hypothetical protein
MDLKKTGPDGVDCVHLAQCRDKWQTVLKKIMNLRVP